MTPFAWFRKRAETPIEQRRYDGIFFMLGLLLMCVTIWAVVDEFSTRRPWKEYQEKYRSMAADHWSAELKIAGDGIDSAALRDIRSAIDSVRRLQSMPEHALLRQQISALDDSIDSLNHESTLIRSRSDEKWYLVRKAAEGGKDNSLLKKEAAALDESTLALTMRINRLRMTRDSLNQPLRLLADSLHVLQSRLQSLMVPVSRAEMARDAAVNMTSGIRQVLIPAFEKSNFGSPKPRVDRCQTCHLGWDEEGMDSVSQPFTRHPYPEMLGIHNPESFGCTPCHRGQGEALTVASAHGEGDSYWEFPLLRGKEVYASCFDCHEQESVLKGGDRFNVARQVLAESGCYGCHEIKGFNSEEKAGPELTGLSMKTARTWLIAWLQKPRLYSAHTRMPDFRFTADEATAITSFLVQNSSTRLTPAPKGAYSGGNPGNGKELFSKIGCTGCHAAGSDTLLRHARGTSYDIAPDLSRAGEKLNPDWIFEWIRNPRSLRPSTRMPSLRVSDAEARDLTAFIGTLGNTKYQPEKEANGENSDLVKRGKQLVRDYGCAGCHLIPGLESEPRVSVSLSNFGRKRLDELDFGDSRIKRTWDDWLGGKLRDPRQFSTGQITLRMPVYDFSDGEIAALRTLLRGMVSSVPEPAYRSAFDDRKERLEGGRKILRGYHCTNCHQAEETGGYYRSLVEDEAMAPPSLNPEGAKVQEPWLQSFLASPSPVRPWLDVRMPSFGLRDTEVNNVAQYFLALQNLKLVLRDYRRYRPDPASMAAGKKLFTDLRCATCHPAGNIKPAGDVSSLAPDLTMAAGRLKPEWVSAWIGKPDSIQPGTRMPTFFPDPGAPSPYSPAFGGNTRAQIDAVRDYIWMIGTERKLP
jgi:mono/diheme cytochrome c family protein